MASVTVPSPLSSSIDSVTAEQGNAPWTVRVMNELVPQEFDEIAFTPSARNPTVITYLKASAVVATLNLTYSAGVLVNVKRV
jgi:hypothetical protein